MPNINEYSERTGKLIKNDNSVINIADLIETVYNTRPLVGSFEQITIDNTVGGVALTPAKYSGCKGAFITVETTSIRFTVDQTAPTSALGHVADDGDSVILRSTEEIANFRAIRVAGNSAKINVTYNK